MLADILLNRINCRIVALTAANYKYAGQANLRYMNMNIVLTRRKSKKSAVQRPMIFCDFLFCYNNFLLFFNPFNACAEMLGNKADRSVGSVIFDKCRRVKFNFLSVYNSIFCSYGD